MNFGVGTFSLFLVAMTMSHVTAFSVGGTFLSAAEKAALEETAAAVATAGKGITGMSRLYSLIYFDFCPSWISTGIQKT